jgi:hypothetical protein
MPLMRDHGCGIGSPAFGFYRFSRQPSNQRAAEQIIIVIMHVNFRIRRMDKVMRAIGARGQGPKKMSWPAAMQGKT